MKKVEWDDNVTSGDDLDPGSLAEQEFAGKELIDKIKELSPAQREVIALRFGAELSVAEVARALGKSPGTVKALQYNGIVALRKLMVSEK